METETPLPNPEHFATGGELPPKEAHIYRSVRAELQKLPDVYEVICLSHQDDGEWLYLVKTPYSTWPTHVIGQVAGEITSARPIYRCGNLQHALLEWDSLNARGAPVMEITPEMQERVCQIVAENITSELRVKAGGDFANWFLLPLATAAQMVGMTTKQLPKRIPVTQWGPSSHGVLFGMLMDKLKERTVNPDGTPTFPKPQTKEAA